MYFLIKIILKSNRYHILKKNSIQEYENMASNKKS
jgi:hypothetical protein